MKLGVNISIDVTKLDKSKFFKGKKGTYADLTVFIDTEQTDNFGKNGSVKQKAERDEQVPLIGSAKIFWQDTGGSTQQTQPHPNQTGSVPQQQPDNFDFDDSIPF